MTWLLAASFVAAATLFIGGLDVRPDPRVEKLLYLGSPSADRARVSLAAIGGRVRFAGSRDAIATRLAAAGRPSTEADRFLGLKVLLGLAGLAFGTSAVSPGGASSIVAAALLAVAAYRFPDFLLARQASRVRIRMSGTVPELMDLLAVSVTAGLTPRLALDRATDAVADPLGEELRRARRDVALGGPWRAALHAMARRTGLDEIRRLAVTLDRSERLGAPVAEHLRALAREVRSERQVWEEERARRAPVLMLFPLVFLILPAFVLAAVVPAVLVATRGIP